MTLTAQGHMPGAGTREGGWAGAGHPAERSHSLAAVQGAAPAAPVCGAISFYQY